jgi:PKD repeat protein
VGGAFYGGSTYPPEYHGAFFFGDYSRATLWTLQTDSSGGLVRAPEPAGFGTGLGGPVALQSGPNGDIAYADIIGGAVRRLVYAPGNRPPTAVISTIVNPVTRTVSFSAAQSYDLDGDQLAASWDFGDGTTSSAADPTHAYADGGPYVVRLTVTDALGAAASSTATVSPDNHTPTLVLDAPDQRYEVGAPVKVAVRASDDEDGDLTANVSWQVTLRHCSPDGSCHLHPGSSSTGPALNAAFTDHGSDTTMVITAAVSDSVGATTQATYEARPDLHTLTVSAPVPVRVNGEQLIGVRAVTGSTNSVAAPVVHSYWEFVGWSDGGGPTREVTMPAGDLALVAAYRTAIAARYAAIGGSSSRLGNASSLEFDVPDGRARDYQRSRMYWSPTTGAKFVLGGIYVRYTRTGAHAAWGFPTTDEFAIAGGAASYFQRANIYWTQATGAHEVHGSIRKKYLALGGPAGYGFPLTDEVRAADGIGRYSDFAGNRSVYWTTVTGAHEIRGSIKTAWLRLGAGRSRLRYPTSDEIKTSYGAVSRFQGGRIEWRRSTNATKTFYSQ